jgi:hypothetical protein
MGLGTWKNKRNWHIPWFQVKDELKIFGFQIKPLYKQSLENCWTACYNGFNGVLISWYSRQLDTLVMRVEVLRISKLWYMASALPLPAKYAKKFESAMFVFCGWES